MKYEKKDKEYNKRSVNRKNNEEIEKLIRNGKENRTRTKMIKLPVTVIQEQRIRKRR